MRFGSFGASMLAIAISVGVSNSAFAEEAPGEDDAIIVTGTRRADVTTLAAVSPVDVVSQEALETSGSSQLVQALRTLVPSASFAQTGGVIGSRLAQSISLRGLPAGNTLVLVNGRRRNLTPKISTGNEWSRGSQPVDINDIPQSAVERVEVLRDGASAQYGSDAIAGVVNIILRGNREGGSVYTTVGQYYEGDGFTASVGGWYNVRLGDAGFVNFSVDARRSERTYRDDPFAFNYYFPGDPREATAKKTLPFYSNPFSKSVVGSVNTEYALSSAVTAYAFGTADYRNTKSIYFITPASNGNIRALYPDGQLSKPTYIFHNYDGVAGLKIDGGELGQFDLSTEYGIGTQRNELYNSQNASYGLDTPTDFYLGKYVSRQSTTELNYTKQLNVGYSQFSLTISAGASYRWENFEIGAGEPASYLSGGALVLDGPNAGTRPTPGSTDFAGLQPADAGRHSRNVWSGYLGLEQQLTEKLQVGLAGRYEHYNDFGSATTGKFSARYDFAKAFGIRGGISTGFKAPSMGQVGASSTTSLWIFPTVGAPFIGVSGFYPVNNPVSRALGARDLRPEKSTNYSAGLVLRPNSNASLTVDLYRIDLRDVILPVDNITGPWFTSRLASLGITGISAVRFFQNQANIRVQGIDIVGKYGFDLGDGRLNLSLAANINENKIQKVLANPPELNGSGITLVGRVSQGYLTQWAPDSKIIGTVNYAKGPFDLTLIGVRYGEYKNTAANPANDQTFDPQWVFKLNASYAINKQLSLSVGADNLFNSYPERPIAANRFGGRNIYDLQAPEGANGGYYYLTLRAKI